MTRVTFTHPAPIWKVVSEGLRQDRYDPHGRCFGPVINRFLKLLVSFPDEAQHAISAVIGLTR